MRPLKLRMAGLRSYRSERTLDFTGRSLMAILGDTGAGKSSLLEGIYGALYGACTWEGRGLGPLIADGVKTLQIELVFSSRGKTYTVSRSTSRDAYPPAKHILKGPDGEHVDGERAVTRRVEQIVGLTEKEFLRVVILPQSRFGQLLQGTAGERAPILRGILGLGVLERVRDLADRQAGNLGAALEPLTAARARLYPDPAAVAGHAQKAVTQHQQRKDELEAIATSTDAVARASTAVEQALPAVDSALEQARDVDLSTAMHDLAVADAAATALDAQEKGFTAQRQTHEQAVTDLSTKLAAAASEGFSPESIARSEAALDQVVNALPTLHGDAVEHAETAAALEGRERAVRDGERAVVAEEAKAKEAKARTEGLEAEARALDDCVRDASRRLTDLHALVSTCEKRAAMLGPAAASVLSTTGVLHAARRQLDVAERELADAQAELEALLAKNRAAHVAAGHSSGQPCPVCSQSLPADFTPPPILGADDLKMAVAAAKTQFTHARSEERDAERLLEMRRQELLAAAASFAETALQVKTVADEVDWPVTRDGDTAAKTTGSDASAESIVDLVVSTALARGGPGNADAQSTAATDLAEQLRAMADAAPPEAATLAADPDYARTLLEPLIEKQTATGESLAQAKTAAEDLANRAARLAATHAATVNQLKQDLRDHAARGDRIGRDAQRLVEQVRALPPMLSDPLNRSLNLSGLDPMEAILRTERLPTDVQRALSTLLEERAEELNDWKLARDHAGTAINGVNRQLAELATARRQQVDRPRSRARTSLERAAGVLRALNASLPALDSAWTRLVSAAPHLPALQPLPPALREGISTDCGDDSLSDTSVAVATCLRESCAAVATIREAVADGLHQARNSIEEAMVSAGVADIERLTEEVLSAAVALQDATERLARAQAQTPVAAGLDEGLTVLRGHLNIFRTIKELMSPSMFPNFVVSARQTALLRIASSLLAKLTRQGYGFGGDFMIVDQRTGQPRHAKTLSGGETFLASLALALALVEISNRSGGHLDALFLDEGFGSLDPSFLADALDVLREQATGGRLVGIISHLHAVAAEVDDVLVVNKGIDGSDFRWLDAEERDHFLLDDVAAGLLA